MKPDACDHFERRCPRLGGTVSFAYCRTAGEDLPQCGKIIDCWWEIFDVKLFLQHQMSEKDFNALLQAKPSPKIASLLEIIAQAKERCRETSSKEADPMKKK